MKLQSGQWFMYQIDDPMPDKLKVYEGPVESPTFVTEINRFQAMAFERWHGSGPVYYSYKKNGRYIDVRVVGDIEAWYGLEPD